MTAPRPLYGGQAVIEGVVIRGKHTLAMACRRPNGEVYRYRETLDSPLQRSRIARLPFVRGVVVLWESLAHGTRLLMRSADIQMEGTPEAPRPEGRLPSMPGDTAGVPAELWAPAPPSRDLIRSMA